MYKGSIVALATPLKDNKVDYESLEKLIHFQIENGTSALLVLGTTGEAVTFSDSEYQDILKFSIKVADKKIGIMAGTGSNNTKTAIEKAKIAKDLGCDLHLSVTPFYNKPNQDGLFAHFKAIADAVDLPMMLYHVPGRTCVGFTPETIGKLSHEKNIIALKYASADLDAFQRMKMLASKDFLFYSGEDALNLVFLLNGSNGSVSVTANLFPKEMALLHSEFFKGNLEKAKQIHEKLLPIHDAMFMTTNPIPVKTALFLKGIFSKCEFRLPMVNLSKENQIKLENVLNQID